jgi:hypothetical protein
MSVRGPIRSTSPEEIWDALRKSRQLAIEIGDQAFDLVLNELMLCITLCRIGTRRSSFHKRRHEEMSRKRLGIAIVRVSKLQLTAKQSKTFEQVFRELAALLPIRPTATVININSLKRSA